jgi:hypothetical protein
VADLERYPDIHLVRRFKLEHGFRSSWNFIPRKYLVDDALVPRPALGWLRSRVHGFDHDSRDFESFRTFSDGSRSCRISAKVECGRLSVARDTSHVGIDASPRLDFLSARRPSAAS